MILFALRQHSPLAVNVRFFVLSLLLWLDQGAVFAQSFDLLTSKTAPIVLERARNGESQSVLVQLEDRAIQRFEDEQRRIRGLKINDDALNNQINEQLRDLKARVFVEGRLGGAVVIEDHPPVPILFVHIPDMPALVAVLAHPSVKFVHENSIQLPTNQPSRRGP